MGIFSAIFRCLGPVSFGLFLAAFVACSSDEKTESAAPESESQYGDWLVYSQDNVVVHYPEDHPFADRMSSLASGYPAAIEADARLLQMAVPAETLHVYVYTGPGQAFDLTGERYPFVEGNHIHYWQPYYLGETVMEYVLSRWTDIEPRFRFLREGLITLMDHSQTSHHETVKNLIDKGERLPLDSLAADTIMNHNRWVLRSQQAASFMDFLIYTYGLPALQGLWVATTDWGEAVRGLLKVTPKKLENEWVEFVERVSRGEKPQPKPMPWRETPPDSDKQ
mgnify:CR=1 FL=1